MDEVSEERSGDQPVQDDDATTARCRTGYVSLAVQPAPVSRRQSSRAP